MEKSHISPHGRPLKWYDYLACALCADLISAGLLHFNALGLFIGVFMYLTYEDYRKNTVPR